MSLRILGDDTLCSGSDEHVVPTVPSCESSSARPACSPHASSSGSLSGSPAEKPAAKGRSRGLMTLKDRKRARKVPARRVRFSRTSSSALSSLKLRKWKAKCDEKYDKKISKRKEFYHRLEAENRSLLATRRSFAARCQALEETTRAIRIEAERSLLSNLLTLFSGSPRTTFTTPQ